MTSVDADASHEAKDDDLTPKLRPISDVQIKTLTPKTIHEQCDALIGADTVDKETSISILKLYGSMETIHAQLQHQRTCETESLKNEIKFLKLSQTHSGLLEPLKQRVASCETQIEETTALVARLQSQLLIDLKNLQDKVDRLEVQMQSTRKR